MELGIWASGHVLGGTCRERATLTRSKTRSNRQQIKALDDWRVVLKSARFNSALLRCIWMVCHRERIGMLLSAVLQISVE